MQKTGGHIRKRECLWEDSGESCNSERNLKEEAWEGEGRSSVHVSPGPLGQEDQEKHNRWGCSPVDGGLGGDVIF